MNANKKRCGAKTRSGGSCQRWARPNGRCNLHGGKSLRGAAAPNFKHGKYSAYLPRTLASRYADARDDPELLSNRDAVALVDARVAELLEQLSAGGGGVVWRQLVEQWGDLLVAIRAGDTARQTAMIGTINQTINRGQTDAETWAEVYDVLERRRRMVDSEQRVIAAKETMITVESALLYLGIQIDAMKRALERYVDDRAIRQKILSAASAANQEIIGA